VSFQVFIEGAHDSSADGVRKLAGAISERYGLPLESLLKRLGNGRFRVKKGVDQATAQAFAADLQRLGALCSVVDEATGAPVAARAPTSPARAPAIPTGAVRSAPPAAKATVLGVGTPPPEPVAAPAAAPAASASSANDDYQSGLSAAFSGHESAQDLGALSQFTAELTPTDAFRLSSLDGQDDAAPVAGPAEVDAGPDEADAAPADPDFDPFAPPDAQSENNSLELAVDAAPKPAPAAPPPAAAAPTAPPDPAFAPPDEGDVGFGLDENVLAQIDDPPAFAPPSPAAQAAEAALLDPAGAAQEAAAAVKPPRPSPRELFRKHVARSPQVRAIVGVVLVGLLAFAPARLYWGAKVAGAQAALNVAMAEEYLTARADARAWEGLQQYGQEQLAFQRTRLSSSRVTAILIMLVFAGGLGFAWFRKVPWDRV